MHRDPTTGVKGVKPRFKSAKAELPELSKRYLTLRNRQMAVKAQAAEVELAIKRGTLVERRLVESQAKWLLLAMRQKLVNLDSHAHQLIGLTDISAVRKVLREIGLSLLSEIRNLPNTVESGWIEEVEADGER